MISQTFIIKLREEDKNRFILNKHYNQTHSDKFSARCIIKKNKKEKYSWEISR